MKIKTLEQAYRFVMKERICTVLQGSSKALSLYGTQWIFPKNSLVKKGGAQKSALYGNGKTSFPRNILRKFSTAK